MTAALSRTIVLTTLPTGTYGTFPGQAGFRWPTAEPGDVLDYSVNASALLSEISDTLRGASIAVRPSGAGELSIVTLTGVGGVLTAIMAGGVSGRVYTAKIDATTLRGLTFEWLISLPIDAAASLTPPGPPPSVGYGAPVTWASAPRLSIDLRKPVSAGLLAAVF